MEIKTTHRRRFILFGPPTSSTFTTEDFSLNAQLPSGLTVDCHRDGHEGLVKRGDWYLAFAPGISEQIGQAITALFSDVYDKVPAAAILELHVHHGAVTLRVVYGRTPEDLANVKLSIGLALQGLKLTLTHGGR